MPDSQQHPVLHALYAPVHRPVTYMRRALRAAAYPLEGIYYFLRHPDFYPLFYRRLIPLSIISFLVYTILFWLVFWPQFFFLAIFHGWGAWVNAIVLFLGEGLVIIQGLFEGFFVDECRVDVFDVSLDLVIHSSFALILTVCLLLLTGYAYQLRLDRPRRAAPRPLPG